MKIHSLRSWCIGIGLIFLGAVIGQGPYYSPKHDRWIDYGGHETFLGWLVAAWGVPFILSSIRRR